MQEPRASLPAVHEMDFHGDRLVLADVDGQPHIVLRPAVEALGLDYKNQLDKLRGKSWATMVLSTTVAADGRIREMVTVNVTTFLMLLATIDERRVAEAVRPKLIAYQAEVADAIEAYWTRGAAINPRATPEQIAAALHEHQLRMLAMAHAAKLVDPAWLEAKTRHVLARALGEEPEVDLARRPLTVGSTSRLDLSAVHVPERTLTSTCATGASAEVLAADVAVAATGAAVSGGDRISRGGIVASLTNLIRITPHASGPASALRPAQRPQPSRRYDGRPPGRPSPLASAAPTGQAA